ncbi:MAG: hypothetical protein CME72_11570 [Halomonadaceae bacterium]|nr:hypothetical protein [Halomonadaceae bacterium]
MSGFTDAACAIDEAQFLADMTGWPQCIVSRGDELFIVYKHDSHGQNVLETVWPSEDDREDAA